MNKRTFLKNSLIGTVSTAAFAAYPVTLLQKEEDENENLKNIEKEIMSSQSFVYCVYHFCSNNKENDLAKKYAEKIIEERKDSCYAYWMCRDCGSSREWAERIIEERKDGYYACLMSLNCDSSSEWIESFLDKEAVEKWK